MKHLLPYLLVVILACPRTVVGQVEPAAPVAVKTPSVLATLLVADTPTVDYRVLNTLQHRRTTAVNRFWVGVSNTFVLSFAAPVVAACAAPVSPTFENHRLSLDYACESALALTINAAFTMGIKQMVNRPRPWVSHHGDLVCLQHVSSASFPSGHTSFTFTAATSLSLLFPQWYVILPAYLWAGSVAFSRLYVGAHYPTDVAVGALIGTGSALLAHYIGQRIANAAPYAYTPPAIAVTIPF